MLKFALTVLIAGLLNCSWSAVIYDTLYLNKGQLTTIDTNYYAYYAFNDSATFNTTNSKIEIGLGDSLYITVINTDVLAHGFNITNTTGYDVIIPAGDSATVATKFDSFGIYIFYDHQDAPKFHYMGAAGMLVVDDFAQSRFHWNIKDHLGIWNDTLDNGFTVDWTTYYPDYFTINGFSNPLINADTTARVTGGVGDTIRIYITNTGQGIHSIHFHGYHLTILHSSENAAHVGRSKDTFPIKPMESMILEVVPDKIGEYPVHDHNLVAVTGGSMYPNGMFLTMLIE